MKYVIVLFLHLFSFSVIIGQTEFDELLDKSLEELLNIKVSVASKIKETNRETPSIVTVITRQDIKNNNCRDMVDVLNMIPGLVITKDEDYTTFSSRGLFGFEGRTLIMIDEMQVSGLYFGAYVVGDDFPVHLIERVEVIRGAGSVLYGGMAELTVIKIITKSDEMENRGNISVRYGQLPHSMGHADAGFSFTRTKRELSVSALGYYGQARRSDAEARYLRGNAVYQHNEESSGLESGGFVLNSKFKSTQLGVLFKHYRNNQIRRFDVDPVTGNDFEDDAVFSTLEEGMQARRVQYSYTTFGANLSHQFEFSENFKLIPTLNYHYNFPFKRNVPREEVEIQRFKPSVYGLFTKARLDIILGGEYFFDAATIIRPEGFTPLEYLRKSIYDDGKNEILISNYALFGNLKYKFRDEDKLHLTVNGGFRYDINELYGQKFNPRAAVNIVVDKFHAKLLYSSAFRAPLVANNAFSRYGLNPDPDLYSRDKDGVKPEETQLFEVEMGYLFAKNLFFVTNAFYQTVNNIIELRYNYLNSDLYSDNGGKIGTYGLESELKFVSEFYSGNINFSYVQPVFYDDVNEWAYSYAAPKGGDTYIAPDNVDGYPVALELLGIPDFKIYTNHVVKFTSKVSINFNALYQSEKRAYVGGGESKLLGAQVILGAGLNFNKIYKHLNIGLSIHDLLNERLSVATAWYDSVYDFLPYKGREISVSLSYVF